MKRTAFAVVSLVVLFSTVVASQLCSSANANPNWRPWENAPAPPIITIHSPVEHQSYPSTEVVLSFTVTKPAEWLDSGKIELVAYFVDAQNIVINPAANQENIVQVEDPSDAENIIPSFSFSFNLTGLKDGPHRVMVDAEAYVSPGTGVGTSKEVDFITYTSGDGSQPESVAPSTPSPAMITSSPEPSPENTPAPLITPPPLPEPSFTPEPTIEPASLSTSLVMASSVTVAVVCIGFGLLLYLIRRR